MKHINQVLSFLFFFFVVTAVLQAQPGVTSEAEVKAQEIFIEGNRERILGNYEKAVEFYRAALKKSPQNPAINYELARVYDVLDEDENALKAIKSAVERDSENMWFRMFLGDVYQKMEKNSEAAAIYKDLCEEYPNEEYHFFKQAFFLVRAKEYDDAIKVYDQMEKKFGLTEEFVNRKHTLYVGMGDNKKAARELQKLIDAFPSNTDYLHLLAGFYDQVGQKEEAKGVYTKILQLDPKDAKAQLAMAGKGQNNDDVAYLNSLKPIFENEDEEIDTKIKALFPFINKVAETKEPALIDATLDLASILRQAHPNDAKAFSISGDLLYYAEKPQEALVQYQKTTQLNESIFAVWEQILYIHAESNNADDLIATSEKVMDIFPNQPKAYYMNAIGQMDKQNHNAAIDALQQAAMMSRKNPELKLDVLSKLVLEYTHLKKYDVAQKQLDKALEMRADHYRVLHAQGFLQAAQGKQNEANTSYETALKNGGDKDAMLLEHYGDFQAQQGNNQKALKYWKQAQENGGNSDTLRKKVSSGTL